MKKEKYRYWCDDCEGHFVSDKPQCHNLDEFGERCGSKNVAIDEPIIRRPKSPLPTKEG